MMEGVEFDQALDICLERLRAGDKLEDCLTSYPSHAERLAPLLRMFSTLQAPDGPAMSSDGFDAGQARLLARSARLRQQRQSQAATAGRKRVPGLLVPGLPGRVRRLVLATMAGVLLLSVVLSAGTVSAASSSLPGSPLYPIKRVTESVVSSLAPTPQLQARAHMAWADRRLREIETLVTRDGLADETLLEDLARQTERALVAAEQAGVGPLKFAVFHTSHQQAVLKRVLENAPAAARPGLERALEVSSRGHARARFAFEKATKPGPPHTPPGQDGDKQPPPHKQETPSAVDSPGQPASPSEAGGGLQKPGKGRSQEHGQSQGQDQEKGQGQGQGHDKIDDPGQGHGKGQNQGQDQVTDPNHGQGQGQDKVGDQNHGQGNAYGQDKEKPGPPDKDNAKDPKINPTPAADPGHGPDGAKPDKPDKAGQNKDKSK